MINTLGWSRFATMGSGRSAGLSDGNFRAVSVCVSESCVCGLKASSRLLPAWRVRMWERWVRPLMSFGMHIQTLAHIFAAQRHILGLGQYVFVPVRFYHSTRVPIWFMTQFWGTEMVSCFNNDRVNISPPVLFKLKKHFAREVFKNSLQLSCLPERFGSLEMWAKHPNVGVACTHWL